MWSALAHCIYLYERLRIGDLISHLILYTVWEHRKKIAKCFAKVIQRYMFNIMLQAITVTPLHDFIIWWAFQVYFVCAICFFCRRKDEYQLVKDYRNNKLHPKLKLSMFCVPPQNSQHFFWKIMIIFKWGGYHFLWKGGPKYTGVINFWKGK